MSDDETATVTGKGRSLTGLAFAVLAFGLLGNLANLLNFHGYPAISGETALLALILLGMAGLGSALHGLAQPRLSFLVTGLIVALLIDFGSDLSLLAFYATAAIIALLAWFHEREILKLAAAAFGAVLIFQVLALTTGIGRPVPPDNQAKRLQDPARAASRSPPIVHLILDSYIGLDGMSAPDTGFGTLRQEQEAFFLAHGFQLYPQAYSRHAKTINALPELLSYGRVKQGREPRAVQYAVAPALPYFEDLDRAGYRTSVSAPSFVDFCINQPLTRCRNYNRSHLAAMAGSGLAVTDRAKVLGLTMLELSDFTARIAAAIDRLFPASQTAPRRHVYNRAKLYSLTGLRELERFSADLGTLRRGEVRFIHLLLPHDPYLLDGQCRILPEADWIDEHGPATEAERDAAYARQVRCVTNGGLRRLLAALERTEAGRAAIVVIHGDHGSRTIDSLPAAGGPTPGQRALAVTHSAFFAIRVPGEAAAIRPGRVALDELFGSLAANRFAAAPSPVGGPPQVYLMDADWVPRRRISLPDFTRKLTGN
ncbi:MAG: hypothetical protein ACK4YM_09395 [Novosphingobium sp.]